MHVDLTPKMLITLSEHSCKNFLAAKYRRLTGEGSHFLVIKRPEVAMIPTAGAGGHQAQQTKDAKYLQFHQDQGHLFTHLRDYYWYTQP